MRDYFSDLGLRPSATEEEIRKAYKILARRFHPDVNPLDAEAAEHFRRIQAAFKFLSSAENVKKLKTLLSDRHGRQSYIEALSQTPSEENRLEEILDLHLGVDLSVEAWTKGLKRNISFSVLIPCLLCSGHGGALPKKKMNCRKCKGRGQISIQRGALQWKKTCENCLGKGIEVLSPCASCEGRGKMFKEERVAIEIPPKLNLEDKLLIKGYGHTSYDGKKRGDVWLQIRIKK